MFDPFGLICPFVLEGKKILQELCRNSVVWDDPISQDVLPRWKKWLSLLFNLNNVRISRCYKDCNFGQVRSVELHFLHPANR